MKKLKPSKLTAISSKAIIVFVGIFIGGLVICLVIGYILLEVADPITSNSQVSTEQLKQDNSAGGLESSKNVPEKTPIPPEQYSEQLKEYLADKPFDGAVVYKDFDGKYESAEIIIPYDENEVVISVTPTNPNCDLSGNGRGEYADLQKFYDSSYSVVINKSYRDYWTRSFEYYLPKFTSEISGDGVEKIKDRYYQQFLLVQEDYKRAGGWKTHSDGQVEYELDDLLDFRGGGELGNDVDYLLTDDFARKTAFCQTYSQPIIVGNYLSVTAEVAGYWGGTIGHYHSTDVFDLTTGKVLTSWDIFETKEKYMAALKTIFFPDVAQYLFDTQLSRDLEVFTDHPSQPLPKGGTFRFTADGIEIVYPNADVSDEVPKIIPYSETKIQI